ncbi:MAG: hypothetical protein AB7G25_06060 [Sphingomonadaceae bacterium]
MYLAPRATLPAQFSELADHHIGAFDRARALSNGLGHRLYVTVGGAIEDKTYGQDGGFLTNEAAAMIACYVVGVLVVALGSAASE